jgi:hypothetical protein
MPNAEQNLLYLNQAGIYVFPAQPLRGLIKLTPLKLPKLPITASLNSLGIKEQTAIIPSITDERKNWLSVVNIEPISLHPNS